MKLSGLSAIAVTLASMASVAVAKSCVQGGVYCGQSLLNRGNYRDHIIRVLHERGLSTDENHILKSLFRCVADGEIVYQEYCSNGCGGVGSDEADWCLSAFKAAAP